MSNPIFNIQTPADIRNFSINELEALAVELRQTIISTCLKNGGHLGASLGVVELAIALHFVFDSPNDSLVWDIGHQAYAHKLLTGRWKNFNSLRTKGGVSGFLSRKESIHDVFGAGHSSTAFSAALAISWANGRKKPTNNDKSSDNNNGNWTVAIVGDGGMTAGLSFEALNNVRSLYNQQTLNAGPFLLVLNDNQLSISSNTGGIPGILSEGRGREFFELFGLDFAGPVNGHDLPTLIGVLQKLKNRPQTAKPFVLHVLTEKGRGYAPAEETPSIFHGVSAVPADKNRISEKTFSHCFGEYLCELAAADPAIVAITAAMTEGTGLEEFARRFPERFFDVGIAEPHAVTFAAGLATQRYKPVVAIYSTFLQRGLDQVIHDVALQQLGVTFVLDRAGLVGADGPTHHGVFDLAYLGMIPKLTVSTPSCFNDLSTTLRQAIGSGQPWAIRYPKGSDNLKGSDNFAESGKCHDAVLKNGFRCHQKPPQANPLLITVALGMTAERTLKAVNQVDPNKERIMALSFIDAKPLPQALIDQLLCFREAAVLFVEDGVIRGGVGQALLHEIKRQTGAARIGRWELAGFGDHFIEHGSSAELEDQEQVSTKALIGRMQALLS